MYLNSDKDFVGNILLGLTLTLDVFKQNKKKRLNLYRKRLTLTLDVFKPFSMLFYIYFNFRLTLTLDVFKYQKKNRR